MFLNPSPPGLLAHPWVPGGAYHAPPAISRSRARRHSNALDNALQNHVSEFKIEVTCEVKVRSNVKIRRFDVLGPWDQDYRTWWLKLRQNVFKGMVKVWHEYKWHTKKTSRSRSGHNRSLYVRIVINTRTGGGSENHTVWRGAYNAPPHRSQLLWELAQRISGAI